jgi:phosphoribosylaminoimidazole-succinocarboxamide synthase
MTDAIVADISARYIELYENITGEKFHKSRSEDRLHEIEENTKNMIARLR